MDLKLDQFKDVYLVIDKANDVFIQRQFVSQGDYKGRSLTVQVTNNGNVGEVPGLTLNLNWHNEASGLTDLTAFNVLDKKNSIFRIEYPDNMMTPGKVYASIQIIQDGKVTNLRQFELIVQKLAGQPVGIAEKAEFSALVAVLADSNKFRTDIDKKADKNYINDYLSKVTVVPETFANLATIKAKYPNGSNGVMVAADNGHKYIWTNGVWTDAGVYQSVGIADGSISSQKLQDSARNVPTILVGPQSVPNYDDNSKTLSFGSNSSGTSILFWSDYKHYEIPSGLTVTNDAANSYTSTKLIFDTTTSKFSYVAWNINLAASQFVVLSQKESWGSPTGQTIISANFPVTVNGRLQGSSYKWARIIPSTLLKPNYSDTDHIFDFNSLKRRSFNEQGKWEPQACLILDSQNSQSTSTFIIPKDTRVINTVASESKSSWSMLIFNANDKKFRFQEVSNNLSIGDWIVAVIRDNTYDTGTNLMQTTVTANGPVTVNGLDGSLVINPKDANVRGILHRGVSDYAPEESWQAYQLAYQFGYYNVEGDIQFTKDNVPVMIHDKTINRVAVNKSDKSKITGDVAVAENNYQDLLDKYDYCKINGNVQEYYYGTSLLTFDDLLKICKKYNYSLHAELKIEMTDDQIEQLVHLARSYGMDSNIFWQSSNPEWFKHLKEIAPDSNFCFLISTDPTENLIATMKSYQTGLLHGRVYAYVSHSVDKSKLVTYKENGIDVVVWTFYSDAAIQDWGINTCVNGIMVQGDVNVARALMRA